MKLQWHVDVRKHPIKELVLNVLELQATWPDGRGSELEVPLPREEVDCIVRIAFSTRAYLDGICRTASNGSLDISSTRHDYFTEPNIYICVIETIHLCLMFLPSDDCALHNHLPDIPTITTKQKPFQPLPKV